MKKKIFLTLAVAALSAVGLAGCQPTDVSSSNGTTTGSDTSSQPDAPEVVSVIDVLSWNSQTNQAQSQGDWVTFEDVIVLSKIDGGLYVMQQDQTLDPIQIFVENEDDYELGNILDVTGYVGTFEDRVVLENATATKTSDGVPNFYYYAVNRATFEIFGTRLLSGAPFGITLELTSAPGTLKVGESKTFYVTFPGEDHDNSAETGNPFNYFVMPVYVPGNLTAREVLLFNQTYASLQEGDLIDGYFLFHWKNGQAGFLFSDLSLDFCYSLSAEDYANAGYVFKGEGAGSKLSQSMSSFFLSPESDYIPTDLGNEDVYSYVVDDTSYGGSQGGYLVSVNAYTYNTSYTSTSLEEPQETTVFEDYVALFTSIEGMIPGSTDTGYAEFYSEESSLVLGVQEAPGYVILYLQTENPTIFTGSNLQEVVVAYEDVINSYITDGSINLGLAEGTTFDSALPASLDSLPMEGVELGQQSTLSRRNEGAYLNQDMAIIQESFANYYYTNDATQEATLATLREAFDVFQELILDESTGFVLGTSSLFMMQDSQGNQFPADVAFNETTNELVLLSGLSGRYGTGVFSLEFDVYVFDESLITDEVFTPATAA